MQSILRRAFGRGLFPHELAFVLTSPLRRLFQPPRLVVGRLPIEPTFVVLEIGPGAGYFSIELARAVPHGRLVLIDVQHQMLEKARRRLEAAGATNTIFVHADASDLPLAVGSVDCAVLVAALGEIRDPVGCIDSLRRVIRPGGIVSITELRGDPDAVPFNDAQVLMVSRGFVSVSVFRSYTGFTACFTPAPSPVPMTDARIV